MTLKTVHKDDTLGEEVSSVRNRTLEVDVLDHPFSLTGLEEHGQTGP